MDLPRSSDDFISEMDARRVELGLCTAVLTPRNSINTTLADQAREPD
jgi:hypothetical protein